MEDKLDDPHEQRLLSVFRSCLSKSEENLDRRGLMALCDKLELEEDSRASMCDLLDCDDNYTVSFAEFRDAFITLLGKSQELYYDCSDQEDYVAVACNGHAKETNRSRWDNPNFQVPSNSPNFKEDLNFFKAENFVFFDSRQKRCISKKVVVELWKSAGVPEASALLTDMGFSSSTVNLEDFCKTLSTELEVQQNVEQKYSQLLRGVLILYQEEAKAVNSIIEQLYYERDKLRADILESNMRANLLAQEIDDHHSRMEKSRREEVQQLESKHDEQIRDLTSQFYSERERHSNAMESLQGQVKKFENSELRTKNELASVLRELRALETENQSQAEKIAELERCKAVLSKQVQELTVANEKVEKIDQKANEQISDLTSKVERLQTEVKRLKDHNDELISELYVEKGSAADKVHENIELMNGSIGKLKQIVLDFRKVLNGGKFCDECLALRNKASALISELETYNFSSQPVVKSEPVNSLANELSAVSVLKETEEEKLRKQCADLEKSLELLRIEYEQCEDYWALKLEEERQIYDQEKKISDEKFSELLGKMIEYEELFNDNEKSQVDGRLSPIQEQVELEQQYLDLDDDFRDYKFRVEKELRELRSRLEKPKFLMDRSVQCNRGSKVPKVDIENDSNFSNLRNRNYERNWETLNEFDEVDNPVPSLKCLNQKKKLAELEYNKLLKRRDKLKREIFKYHGIRNLSSPSQLYEKLFAQDQKLKHLQICIRTQQKKHDGVIQEIIKQNLCEVSNLKVILKNYDGKFAEQMQENQRLREKLIKTDLLAADMYKENAQLLEKNIVLEQHCQVLCRSCMEALPEKKEQI